MWGSTRIRLTETELKMDALSAKFRNLEQEWNATLSRYDSILKRCNRLLKLEKEPETEVKPANMQDSANAQMTLVTPELIERIWRQKTNGQ